MPIESRLMSLGSWSVSLSPDTPASIIQSLMYGTAGEGCFFGHVFITPITVDPTILRDSNFTVDPEPTGLVRYTGVIRAIDSVEGEATTLSGASLLFWLGDDQGRGVIVSDSGNPLTASSGTLTDWIIEILASFSGRIKFGNVTEPAPPFWDPDGSILGGYQPAYVTPLQILQFVCGWFNAEFRVRPNGYLDVGMPWDLWPLTSGPTLATDGFTRADSVVTLGSLETGQPWTALTGTWGISSNEAYMVSTTLDGVATFNVLATQSIDITAHIHTTATVNRTDRGIVFRCIDTNNFLLVQLLDTATDDRLVRIVKRVGGTYTMLNQTVPGAWTPNDQFDLRVTLSSETGDRVIRVFKDDSFILDYVFTQTEETSFSVSTATKVGFFVSASGSLDNGTGRFDELIVRGGERPSAIAVRKPAGRDPEIDSVETQALHTHADVEDWVNRVYVLVSEGVSLNDALSSDQANPNVFYDLFGLPVEIGQLVPSNDDLIPDDALAQVTAFHSARIRRSTPISSLTYDIEGFLEVGSWVYIYDPIRGLFDMANPIQFRGEIIYPLAQRIYGLTWPIEQGMGVYYRDTTGNYTDLTPWVVWEDAGGAAETGVPPSITDQERDFKQAAAKLEALLSGRAPGDSQV